MVKHLGDIEFEALRAERQRLAQECARLVWLRRLVTARRDLEVARLIGAGLGGCDGVSLAVRQALDDVARPCPELFGELAQSVRTLTCAVDGAQRDLDAATGELVHRYRLRPELCLAATAPPPLADAAR